MPPKSHLSLLPPQNSDVYNPFANKREKNVYRDISWPLSSAGLSAIVMDLRIPQLFEPTGHPSKQGCCAFVPIATKNEIMDKSIGSSTALGLRSDMSEKSCSVPCVAPAKHEAIVSEHLADFIDVFRRRLEKHKREFYPERYATSEVESLLQELEQLREEEGTLLEEIRQTQWKRGRGVEGAEAGWREDLSEGTDIYFSPDVLRSSSPISLAKSNFYREEAIRRAEARKVRKSKAQRKERKRKSRLANREVARFHMPLVERSGNKPVVPREDEVREEKKNWPKWWIPEQKRLSPLIPPPAFGLGLEEAVNYGFDEVGARYHKKAAER